MVTAGQFSPSACESTRGSWGGICPDCGNRLPPKPQPLSSWQSQRAVAFPSGSSAGLGDRDRRWSPERVIAERGRRRGGGRPAGVLTERQMEIARIVRKHGGNKSAAARELGLTVPTVITSMRRYEAAAR